jgi:two-component system, OmpR family, sensor kinase
VRQKLAMKTKETGWRRVWSIPRRWPVRWRIAAVSATLTLLILLVFAFVVGRLVSDRMEDDFHDDMFSVANQLRLNIEAGGPRPGEQVVVQGTDLNKLLTARDVGIRVVYESGSPYLDPDSLQPVEEPSGAPDLGLPQPGKVTQVGSFDVVSVPIFANSGIPSPGLILQYGRNRDSLEATIGRLWLFLGGGVLGGTILAFLAGMAVAGRAMQPIKDLTQTARKIAATRDPSERVPMPEADDEIAELATTLDQMLHELDASRTETEQLAQAQREFVADASHELRTPLTSILANLELLQDRLAQQGRNGEEAEIVEGALHSSKRMRRLVADLLLLARADAGRAGVRSDCDLAAIVGSALVEVRPVAGEHELVVGPMETTPVKGNPDDLHRLVVNLLENGVRHTPAETRIHVDLRREDHTAVLEVADDGPGIPPGMESQVFSRFVRGTGPADTKTDGGTGLGLAIVQAVATSHGGSVEAGKAPHGGAQFTVRLPLAERVGAEAPTPVHAPV